ncbi:MAG: exo-beta-N-acetylmuramidase NamZ family protein [Longimicrobiaceae bacterium]
MSFRQPFIISALLAGCATAPVPAPVPPVATPPPEAGEPERATGVVLPGLEVLLRDSLHLVRGERAGLLTNQSAVTSAGESGIDLLHRHPGVELVALYGPEHGLRGGIEGGEKIEGGVDEATGLPVHSLYGETRRPTPEMLAGIDVLLFDMQDVGARPYTFIWTMAMAMEAAAGAGIPFVVLDRPNPITARVEGPLMEMEMRHVWQPITGYYPVPLRHGMTVGEIALYVNGEFGVGADLHVVPAAGWRGSTWFDQTGLPWIDPSPNIRSLEAALTYAGLVLLEGTNLSVGRGTEAPFSYVGAPWVDEARLARRLAARRLPGVSFEPVTFTPAGAGWVPYRDETVHGVKIGVTDRNRYQSVRTALVLMHEIRALHPGDFEVTNDGFTQMIGSRWAREAFDRGVEPDELLRRWRAELEAWLPVRERYRLYPR